jgi:hypothetical protein
MAEVWRKCGKSRGGTVCGTIRGGAETLDPIKFGWLGAALDGLFEPWESTSE